MRADTLGIALAVLAGLSYATYSVIGGHLIGRGHPLRAGSDVRRRRPARAVVLLACGAEWLLTARSAAVA